MRYDLLITSRGETSKSNFRRSLLQPIHGVTSVAVRSLMVPVTWYQVHSGNYTVRVEDSGATGYSVTLTPGNYSIDELCDHMKARLDAVATFATWTVTNDVNTLKIGISATATFKMVYALTTASKLIGLASDSSVASSWTATNVYNVSRTERIHVLCPSLKQVHHDYDGAHTSRILSIPLDVNPGEVQRYVPEAYGQDAFFLGGGSLSDVDLTLADDDGVELDLNGLDWSIEFRVEGN
jgi:hypothetical protein